MNSSPSLPAPRRNGFHVYAVEGSDGSVYIGHTENLRRRWQQHMAGQVQWTTTRRPLTLTFHEACTTRQAAIQREQELKTGFGRKWFARQMARGAAGRREGGKTVGAGVISQIVA